MQTANKNGKPSQLLPDLLMIAWITLGPIMDDALVDKPNKPKNCICGAPIYHCSKREEEIKGKG